VREVRRWTAAACAATLALAPGAAAHGGTLLGSAVTGPYRTQVTAAPLHEPGRGPQIDVTVYVSDAASGTPASGLRVRTAVEVDGHVLRPPVREIAGGYEAIVPVPGDARVGDQRIDVTIDGPRGSGRLTIEPTEDGGPPTALLAGTAVALAALVALALRARRRRDQAGEEHRVPDEADATT